MINVFNSPIEASSLDEFHRERGDKKDTVFGNDVSFYLNNKCLLVLLPSSCNRFPTISSKWDLGTKTKAS